MCVCVCVCVFDEGGRKRILTRCLPLFICVGFAHPELSSIHLAII